MRISRIAVVLIVVAAAMPALAQEVISKDGKQKISAFGTNNAWKGNSTGWQSLGPSGTWWRDQRYVVQLSLTTDQQKKMDDVFQQSRIKLIDSQATFDKEEAILEPLMNADRLDESRVAAQIDKVADARAELEKATARMLLGIRQVLTPEQWTKLNSGKFVYTVGTPGIGGYSRPVPFGPKK